ncbi:ABC transporter permease subunit [Nakamurella sp. YIM 132087]|uniref:ABC transporter permease subunit n=1 Tax=Nakamurella alba TaxID=2665158 RepID=A0A7K1FR54_9ACTN|nr:ABC transporter permease [Nakamurella alba]MTD16625.1 ABC transporter permease subunit [Nakamurella alba]
MSSVLAVETVDLVDGSAVGTAPPRRTRPRRSRRWTARVGVWLSWAVIALVVGWAFLPGVFAHQDPLAGNPVDKLQAPSGAHWFGTDYIGRDLFARVVHGSALSLQATVLAVAIGLVFGSAIGLWAGWAGGRTDSLLMRVVDVLLAVPGLLLSLTVVVALGFGTINVAIAVGVGIVASFARLMRSEVLRIRSSEFVEAAGALGRKWYGVLGEHVLPNAAGPVLALATLEFGTAILSISSLSFLGFGAQPPAPEWGQLVSEGRNYLAGAWWLTTLPGLVVVAVVLAANRIGRDLERRGVHR